MALKKTEVQAIFKKRPGMEMMRPPQTKGNAWGKQDMQFPGKGNLFPADTTIEEIRDFIKNQKRLKGFTFDVPTGTSQFPLQISGEAKLMLGISLVCLDAFGNPGVQPTQFSMLVNEEIIITQAHPVTLSPDFMDEEYYLFLRPLSGQDDVSVVFVNPNAGQRVTMGFFYL